MSVIVTRLALVEIIIVGIINAKVPNFVIMLMDDMGWGDLGVNGQPSRETPHIDQLARDGLTASSMYTSAPLCSPSRAALLTGRLPIRNGFYSDNAPGRNAYTPQNIVGGIAASEVLLPELLISKGFTNALVGKWHLGHRAPHLPLQRGFHHWVGSPNCHFGPYDDVTTPNIPVFLDDHMSGRYFEEYSINLQTGESNMTKLFTEAAVDFIHQQAGNNPFFLLWAPDSTHAPTYASEKFLGASRRDRYGDAVMELDDGVGAIMDALKERGVINNTLVVFTSDNGAALVSKLEGGSNGPFLCGKQTTFEGGMRAPGIFSWPGVIPSGTVTHQVWSQMDLFSTVLEAAGVPLPQNLTLDGMPLLNSLVYPSLEFPRTVFLYRGDRLMAVRRGPYKMHLWTWSTPPEELKQGIDYCPGAFIPNVTTEEPMDHRDQPILYNVEADPSERYPTNPLTQEYTRVVQALMMEVKEHEEYLVKGEPQLNWCDPAVMHWSPPGCQALGKCLPSPPSAPTRCHWPH